MFVVGTDQNPVPFPAAGFRGLDEQQHLTLEEVCGQPTEHSLGEEGPVVDERLENPLVFERLHVFEAARASRGVNLLNVTDSRAELRQVVIEVPARQLTPERAAHPAEHRMQRPVFLGLPAELFEQLL